CSQSRRGRQPSGRSRRRYASKVDADRLNERTTIGLFFRQAALGGDRTVVRFHDGEGWRGVSWRRVSELVQRSAARLVAEGVQPGDRVVIMAENRPEWLYCDLAIQTAGAITVPVYPSTPARVAQVIAEDAGARLAFADDALRDRLQVERLVALD